MGSQYHKKQVSENTTKYFKRSANSSKTLKIISYYILSNTRECSSILRYHGVPKTKHQTALSL